MDYQRIKEFATGWLFYRLPAPVRKRLLPRYQYSIEPVQLACLVGLIDQNVNSGGGVVCEIGVARGYTSIFLLQHIRSTANPTKFVMVDTFSGFTRSSIAYEVSARGKAKSDIDKFQSGSPRMFEKHLRRLGYDNFEVVAGDCEEVDWESLGPIAVVHLDVDLYQPTKRTLERIWPHIIPGGACLVDDCQAGTPWDGALQAYTEFIEEHDMPFILVGNKGGLLRKG